MHSFSYEELAFHLADSRSYRAFCGPGIDEKSPRKSALQNNIKRIRPETLEAINRLLLVLAAQEKVDQVVRCAWTAPWSSRCCAIDQYHLKQFHVGGRRI